MVEGELPARQAPSRNPVVERLELLFLCLAGDAA